jgi:cytochrome c2
MRLLGLLVTSSVFLSLVGCTSDSGDSGSNEKRAALLSAETLGGQTVLTAAQYLEQERFQNADADHGFRQVQICKACHSLDEGGANMIGPALFGFFGRQVGEQSGFGYSPAMADADFVWTPRALDAWLAQPGYFLPGNRMSFAGVMKQKDRDDMIAYLLRSTSAINVQ